MEKNNSTPAITVDIGRHRIRIHRSTLSRLEYPLFVRLLVNPDQKGIVVESCDEQAIGAYRLTGTDHRHSMEVYSPSLISEISSCAGFGRYRAVKLTGRQLRGQNAVFFRLAASDECTCLA